MSTEPLSADLKTRVHPSVKRAFEQIAEKRHLDVADIVREALRDYLEKCPPVLPALPTVEKVQVPA